jgi:general secretion pathway protein K
VRADRKQEEGFALLAVLCWTILLALAVGGIMAIERSQAYDARADAERAKLDNIADAGINIALLALLTPDPTVRPPVNGTPFPLDFNGSEIFVTIWDQRGSVDLNYTSEQVLVRLLSAAGLPADRASTEAQRILDWRESGDLRRLNGAKMPDYQQAGFAYGPRDGAFQTVGELQLVMGIDSPTYAALEPSLTVVSQQSDVDLSLAFHTTLSALGVAAAPTTPSGFGGGAGLPALGPPIPANVIGHALSISARVHRGSFSATRTAMIRLSGNLHQPVWVYSWN